MQIEWRRIWKVLLGCVCTAAGIALLACGQLGWGLTALEAAVLLLALQYAPRGTRLWKTWWFVELVLALAVTAGCAGVAIVREAHAPVQAVVITTEHNVPPETAAPVPTAAPKQPQTTAAADAAYIGNRNSMKYHRAGCRYAAQIKEENRITFDSAEQALTAVTLNGAAAICRADRIGSIEPGKQADILIWNAEDLDYICYRLGSNLVDTVIKKGNVV